MRRATADELGVLRLPLQRYEDERGWFMQLAAFHDLPRPPRQVNVSFSRQGVIRGLHYHKRGQNDVFMVLSGTARVVVMDMLTTRVFTEDIGDDNPVAIWVPGQHAHGFEALTDILFCYYVTREYDPKDPDEYGVPWNDPAVAEAWQTSEPILSARDKEVKVG